MVKFKIILLFLVLLFCNCANANELLIKNGLINGVGVGDPKEKIFSTFSSRYQIIEEKKPGYVPTINLYQDKKKIIMFSTDPDNNNKILFIDVYDNCVTSEKIGIGSMLSDAIKVYGEGNLAPTDAGYLVYFERSKKLSFLLDNSAIPKRLRNIPDDVFTEDQEKEILRLKHVRIKVIKIYGIYGSDGN
jgi:hypothetical protein